MLTKDQAACVARQAAGLTPLERGQLLAWIDNLPGSIPGLSAKDDHDVVVAYLFENRRIHAGAATAEKDGSADAQEGKAAVAPSLAAGAARPAVSHKKKAAGPSRPPTGLEKKSGAPRLTPSHKKKEVATAATPTAATAAAAAATTAAARSSRASRGRDSPAVAPAKKEAPDPNAPKRAVGAYTFFCRDHQDDMKADVKGGPSVSVRATAKAIGAAWHALGESEMAPYTAMAAKDAARYKKEMAAYTAKGGKGPAGGDGKASGSSGGGGDEDGDDEDN